MPVMVPVFTTLLKLYLEPLTCTTLVPLIPPTSSSGTETVSSLPRSVIFVSFTASATGPSVSEVCTRIRPWTALGSTVTLTVPPETERSSSTAPSVVMTWIFSLLKAAPWSESAGAGRPPHN
ncbi:hypothetical protein [Streptomyces anulatus]|uniref:hypothetical protein n=1 Tax=Streptomyces anulatus TaxID=1892 RepID=UPI0004C86896|nr:hypothetical protein [Streptomyces anulatus]